MMSWCYNILYKINIISQATQCCGYGAAGAGTMGFDCVVIPGAVKMTTPFTSVPNQICGGKSVGLVTTAGMIGKTICSKFSLLFYSSLKCCLLFFQSFFPVLKRFIKIVLLSFFRTEKIMFTFLSLRISFGISRRKLILCNT
jgi:hypothetical protein